MSTLNFAVIGAGRFAKNYIRILNDSPDFRLNYVFSRSKGRLSAIKEIASPKNCLTANINEILKDKKTDCAVIATPPSTHFELAKKCILAGKNVLIEKPLATSLSDAAKIRNLAKKHSITFMVGHQYCYNDYFRYLKSEIQKGTFGKISFILGEHLFPGPWNDSGCMLDAGTHKLSMVNFLFPGLKIKKISGTSLDILGKGRDDYSQADIDFGELKFSFRVAWVYPRRSRKLFIFGSKKCAVYDDYCDEKLKIYSVLGSNDWDRSVFIDSIDNLEKIKYSVPKISAGNPILNQLNHFAECVKSKKEPITGIKNSYEISKWLDAVCRKIKAPGYLKN